MQHLAWNFGIPTVRELAQRITHREIDDWFVFHLRNSFGDFDRKSMTVAQYRAKNGSPPAGTVLTDPTQIGYALLDWARSANQAHKESGLTE
jgi:hypothetical protein